MPIAAEQAEVLAERGRGDAVGDDETLAAMAGAPLNPQPSSRGARTGGRRGARTRRCAPRARASRWSLSPTRRASPRLAEADEAHRIGEGPLAAAISTPQSCLKHVAEPAPTVFTPATACFENPSFARLCEENDITFIGPAPNATAQMGHKVNARKIMRAAGVPVVPGSAEAVCSSGPAARSPS